ncbi:Ohr family peroxiredoxin [Lysobacter niastensis]|uniref:Ohr family peroxiredoxin n=1 Tax=Lysobacter niastensis TaxID=380629 RepID=A0ABS0B7X3_9GAMM|nr:Ohr family peroxiredoxin [Lysobacter niastensis]MBF6025100.1 Ohr family peroxiredoxin [Lysobacter niastensis]
MSKIEKVLFTGKTHTSASPRDAASRASHGRLEIKTSASGSGTSQEQVFSAALPHPTAEQLFAGAWSACYSSAIAVAAQEMKVKLPPDVAVEVEVDVGQTGNDYFIQSRFNVIAPGMDRDEAEALVHRAHEICPYSKATHGNIDVDVKVTV